MTLSLNQLGDLLLQDPLTNVNNAALLLAAIRPDCEAVCAWQFLGSSISNGFYIHPLFFWSFTPFSWSQDDTCAALLALQVFFSDACERKQLARPVRSLCSFFHLVPLLALHYFLLYTRCTSVSAQVMLAALDAVSGAGGFDSQ